MGPDTNQCAFIGRNSKKIRLKTCPEQQSGVTPGLTAPQAELQEKGGAEKGKELQLLQSTTSISPHCTLPQHHCPRVKKHKEQTTAALTTQRAPLFSQCFKSSVLTASSRTAVISVPPSGSAHHCRLSHEGTDEISQLSLCFAPPEAHSLGTNPPEWLLFGRRCWLSSAHITASLTWWQRELKESCLSCTARSPGRKTKFPQAGRGPQALCKPHHTSAAPPDTRSCTRAAQQTLLGVTQQYLRGLR